MAEDRTKSKKQTALKAAQITGFVLLCAIVALLLINALLCVFVDRYYPTFGDKRLFAIVSDSMEPEIPTGYMIVSRVPSNEADIAVGDVITYEVRQGNSKILITHRITQIVEGADGAISYITRGDNAAGIDSYRPAFSDVVGVYTGGGCAVFGYIFGFLQSAEGAIALIIIALIITLTCIIIHFVNLVNVWRVVLSSVF